MEQTKRNILTIYLKTAAMPLIEAHLDISKIEKAVIFEWVMGKSRRAVKCFFEIFREVSSILP